MQGDSTPYKGTRIYTAFFLDRAQKSCDFPKKWRATCISPKALQIFHLGHNWTPYDDEYA